MDNNPKKLEEKQGGFLIKLTPESQVSKVFGANFGNIVKVYVLSWDVAVSSVSSLLIYTFFPPVVPGAFSQNIYNVGITVMSIVFSFFFGAFSLIMSYSADDFAVWIEKEGGIYSKLLNRLYFTMVSLFFALCVSLFLYFRISYLISLSANVSEFTVLVMVHSWVSIYALQASLLAILDCVNFSKRRIQYMLAISKSSED